MFVVMRGRLSHALSSRLMRWDDEIFIADLRSTLSYWTALSQRKECSLVSLLRHVLDHEYNGHYEAVVTMHPWQGLLLCEHMHRRHLCGLIDLSDRFGSHLYREISWDVWWECLDRLGHVTSLSSFKGFHPTRYRQSLRRLQQMVTSLSMSVPWDMHTIKDVGIRRRFGTTMERVWSWSFPKSLSILSDLADDFPWMDWKPTHVPFVKRSLDHEVCDWSAIRPLLCEDLDRLVQHICGSEVTDSLVRLTSLKWRLHLSPSHSCVEIPIRFRHPHALHRELASHPTTLLQAQYAFGRYPDDQSIVSWELEADGFIQAKLKAKSLFDDDIGEYQRLMEIENQLSVPLVQYDVVHNWSIEESFAAFDADRPHLQSEALPSICAVARQRPLFVFEKAIPMSSQGSGLWKFCERTMSRWWQADQSLYADYYRYTDANHRSLWVSRQGNHRWYVHGIFS